MLKYILNCTIHLKTGRNHVVEEEIVSTLRLFCFAPPTPCGVCKRQVRLPCFHSLSLPPSCWPPHPPSCHHQPLILCVVPWTHKRNSWILL